MKTNRKRVNEVFFLAVLATMPTDLGFSQAARRTPALAVPGFASPQADAVGSRMQEGGKELTTLIGEYLDEAGQRKAAQVMHQLPNRVMLRGFASRELKFDGSRRPIELPANEAALLETFSADTAEGMLTALQQGAAARLLGRRFKPNATVAPGYAGPSYDIYEVTAPALGSDAPVRKKLYYFDSSSGLLLSTRYHDSSVTPAVRVETRFSEWRRVDGSAYPGRIDRFENNRRVVSFFTTAATSGPAVDVANFR